MADAEEIPENTARSRRYWPRRRRWQFLLVLILLLVVSSILTWHSRETIVGNLVESELNRLGIDASYEIDSIGPTRQVLRNFTIGDPARPDLSIERVEVVPVVGFTGPGIGSITLVHPRLRASYKDGRLSLGALDPLLEIESEEPFSLPRWRLKIVDGRARLFTDHGVIGAKAEGEGRLNHGFSGILAAAGPKLELGGCEIANTRLVGRISVARGQPRFNGPLQVQRAACSDNDTTIDQIEIALELTGDRDLAGLAAKLALSSGAIQAADLRSPGIKGSADLGWRDGLANARYRLDAGRVSSPALTLAGLQARGAARMRAKDGRLEIDAAIDANDPRLGAGFEASLKDWRKASTGTLAEPLLDQFARRLAASLPGSTFRSELTYRQSKDGFTIVAPTARLRDSRGDSLLAASQLQYSSRGDAAPRLAGNFATGGEGLPQIHGRMEAGEGSGTTLRLRMEPYRSGSSSLVLPRLNLAQNAAGDWKIDGLLAASGAIPGGFAEGLVVPVTGQLSHAGELALWQRCVQVTIGKLTLSDLTLERQNVGFCPAGGGAIVRTTRESTLISARTEALALQGQLGESALSIGVGELEFTSAEGLMARQIFVTLSEEDSRSELLADEIRSLSAGGMAGTFSGVSGKLAAVPLDLSNGAGEWRYEGGVLTLADASFTLTDRQAKPRFYPLRARGASLTLRNDTIAAQARLEHPGSSREVTDVTLRHDLASGTGHADLSVPGLVFDKRLQPSELTILADGVIALADGTIAGDGRIDWNADGITSSGTFSTRDFDFAAAFGPVESVSGTVEFSDLLNLTTAGPQRLNIGAINPGVEVFDGVLDFAVRDTTFVSVRGGRWPFFGGTMILRPIELNLAAAEQRSYVIEIVGADAAQFMAAMEMGNLNATGIFDGTVPLVFDEMGNGEIVNGLLISRPPGGNLSYIGELTYEDTGAIANFAFQSLRSLDFNQMMVEMNGPLTGEIVTQVNFDGVRQGQGANQNFITRRIAKLPIRFRVNIRAPFYQLITSLKATYDPAFIRDPRDLGLLDVAGGRLVRPQDAKKTDEPDAVSDTPELSGEKQPIQTQESESMR